MNLAEGIKLVWNARAEVFNAEKIKKKASAKDVERRKYVIAIEGSIKKALNLAMEELDRNGSASITLDAESTVILPEVVKQAEYKDVIKVVQDPVNHLNYSVVKVGGDI